MSVLSMIDSKAKDCLHLVYRRLGTVCWIALTILLVTACGKQTEHWGGISRNGIDALPCTVTSVAGGSEISCPGGTASFVPNGANGISVVGAAGPQGSTGATGAQGPAGAVGATGPAGQNALPCTAYSVSGGVIVSCPGSPPQLVYNGAVGSKGDKGDDGDRGHDGDDGHDGEDSSPITMVKLCPETTSYSGHIFVEYGICMNHQLWGVYSANGGFLSYFPPGAYSSAGIGSSCNLTIGSNCSVSH